jgi:putative endonuclease
MIKIPFIKKIIPPKTPLEIGAFVEKAACAYLKKQGLKLITQNYRCYFGEIDLIMREVDTLVFIEVRYRSSKTHGDAAESINSQKQAKIIRTALYYTKHLSSGQNMRFDAICLDNFNTTQEKNFEFIWIKNAFQVDSYS